MNRTILIVGAGFGQLPAIETAKKNGITTVVVDKNPDAVGAAVADFFYAIDIIDREAVLEIGRKHHISGIMTMQSDLPVPTIGYVNDMLGLTGVTTNVANICSNKNETRDALKKNAAAQPAFEITRTLQEASDAVCRIGFPCVIKASDSSGSRGITRIDQISDLVGAFTEALLYSRNKIIIVEEFIDGLEFGAQTFSVNGKCECVLLHNDTMSEPPYMIPVGHSFPFVMLTDDETKQAIDDVRNAVEAVGITDGPANIDLILDSKSKRVKVIEIGARIGATCLPELIYYHSGIDWVKQTILNCMGEEVDLKMKYNKPVAAIILEAPKDGSLINYIVPEYMQRRALEVEVTVKEGDPVNILRKGTDRIGKILAYGDSVQEAEMLVKQMREKVIFNVE